MIKPFNQLYVTNKTERFSLKSGRTMWVAKLIKEDWPKCYSMNFGSKQLYPILKATVLECKAEEINVPW